MLEHAVRARIESAAVRHGMVARIGLVHVGVWPLLRLQGFDLDLGHGVRLHADMIEATWPGRLRLAVRTATLSGPAGIGVSSPATAWDMARVRGEDFQLTLVEPQPGLSIRKLADPVGSAWNIESRGLDVGHLFDVRRDANPLLAPDLPNLIVTPHVAWASREAQQALADQLVANIEAFVVNGKS